VQTGKLRSEDGEDESKNKEYEFKKKTLIEDITRFFGNNWQILPEKTKIKVAKALLLEKRKMQLYSFRYIFIRHFIKKLALAFGF